MFMTYKFYRLMEFVSFIKGGRTVVFRNAMRPRSQMRWPAELILIT